MAEEAEVLFSGEEAEAKHEEGAEEQKREGYVTTLVPPEQLENVWPFITDRLEKAIERSRGRWSMEALFQALQSETYHLWLAFDGDNNVDGVGVTQVVTYPNRRMLAIQFLGGENFMDWVWSMLGTFNSFARDIECQGIEATGRDGFWKWLSKDGFEKAYTVFEKRLEP